MLKFSDIKNQLQKHIEQMMADNEHLFVVELDKDQLWSTYIESIPPQHNLIYRVNREYDCSACRHFIKQIGNVVAIKDGKLESIWDITTESEVWNAVAKKLSDFVKSHPVSNIYLTKFSDAGHDHDTEMDNGVLITYEHFYTKVDSKFVCTRDIDTRLGRVRDSRGVFKRSLDELTLDSVETVLELIRQDSLYRGSEYTHMLQEFAKHKKSYAKLTSDLERELYVWEYSVTLPDSVCKIRNTSIGTLLIDISAGVELDEAVRKFEAVVAPTNYKRSKPIFTQRMLEDAQKTITDLGYYDSLQRRYANADDISVNNILFINRDTAKRVPDACDLFAQMAKDTKQSPKKFSKVEEIAIDDFISNVLPDATDVEAYVENKHTPNFMSLIAPINADSKTMFKWNNNFSWAYSGNVTDSIMKQNVKNAGGKVDGVLRFSIQWNDGDTWNKNDEDAHCITPNGTEIFFSRKLDRTTRGNLDVDIVCPQKGVPAVENITWPDLYMMTPGTYKFFVNTFSARGGHGGFRAEIEFNGEIYSYNYTADTRYKNNIYVAEVTLNKDGTFSIKHLLPSNVSNKDIWGVTTNEFTPVSVVCYSPNYWDEQNGIGNKHYFFMLKDCVNPELPNAWYNEFLNSDLYPQHRKVMEALATKAHVQECDDQLSGIGFSSTVRNDLVVKVKGKTERILKVKF